MRLYSDTQFNIKPRIPWGEHLMRAPLNTVYEWQYVDTGTFIRLFSQRPRWSPFCLLSDLSRKRTLREGLLVASALRHNLRVFYLKTNHSNNMSRRGHNSHSPTTHSLGGKSFILYYFLKNSLSLPRVVCATLLSTTWAE